jgi:hypothetical protein
MTESWDFWEALENLHWTDEPLESLEVDSDQALDFVVLLERSAAAVVVVPTAAVAAVVLAVSAAAAAG